jgi:hypothetical protein
MTPEIIHLVFALVGAGLGWYYRHRSQRELPPELQDILNVLENRLSQRKEQDAHDLLQELTAAGKAKQPTS